MMGSTLTIVVHKRSKQNNVEALRMGQPDDEPPRSHEACRIEASLRLATVVWSVLLVVAVQLMFAFDHASLVDADRRYLEALHGRAVSAANVTALYASTLEATDGGACLAPREKSCLDGFCSAGDWRDYRRSPLFGCRGGLGAGLPSYELFERATTAASALGGAALGGVGLHACLGLAGRGRARFIAVAAPALALHAAAGFAGAAALFRAVEAAALVAFPHPASAAMAKAHYDAVLRNGYLLVTAVVTLGAAAVALVAPPRRVPRLDLASWRLDAPAGARRDDS